MAPFFKHSELKQLGNKVEVPSSPEEARLETIPNARKGTHYIIRFTCPEFTSLCPITNQPDFAHIVLEYVPHKWLVESKSLKLYLGSFRNHGAFHEDCTMQIAETIIEKIKPVWLRIGGYWYPRGGIPIDIFYQTNEPPESLWIPEQGVPPYRAR